MHMRKNIFGLFAFSILAFVCTGDLSAQVTVQDIMGQKPFQKNVDIDQADMANLDKYKLELYPGNKGYIVREPNGNVVRVFIATQNSGTVDQRSYYKGGVEVYRELDTDGNDKMDQYRWFHTGGSRWGVDENEDGKIDRWIEISPEEVTAEIVESLASGDEARFLSAVLSKEEFGRMFDSAKSGELGEYVEALSKGFKAVAAELKLSPNAKWIMSRYTRPGTIPRGTSGNLRDMYVCEDVIAHVGSGENMENSFQISIGTLIRISDNNWRALTLPSAFNEEDIKYIFFPPLGATYESGIAQAPGAEIGPLVESLQKKLTEFQVADAATKRGLYGEISPLFFQVIPSLDANARSVWSSQAADFFLDGIQYRIDPANAEKDLERLRKLAETAGDMNVLGYIVYRTIMTDYYVKVTDPEQASKIAEIQEEWIGKLEEFASDPRFEKTTSGAEGMLQLASSLELSGEKDRASAIYGKVETNFQNTTFGQRAGGAKRRLASPGRAVPFVAKDAKTGAAINIAQMKGSYVVLYFWASWSRPEDLALNGLVNRYRNNLKVVCINLDSDPKDMSAFLQRKPLPGQHVYEPGGLDCSQALSWGIQAPPTIILFDTEGRVVDESILNVAELEKKLDSLINTQ